MVVAPEPGPVEEVGEEVGGVDGDECPGYLEGAEAKVVGEGDVEGFEEGEDEGVGEAGEEGKKEHDGFSDEHFKRSEPDFAGFFERDAGLLELVGAVDVGVFACFAAALCFAVDEDRGSAFGHEEVDCLHCNAEDELDPKVPLPCEVCNPASATSFVISLPMYLQRSIGPPMTPPMLVPIVDDSTMKHNGQCWFSGSYMSAIRPSVTLPPAVERPP